VIVRIGLDLPHRSLDRIDRGAARGQDLDAGRKADLAALARDDDRVGLVSAQSWRFSQMSPWICDESPSPITATTLPLLLIATVS